MFKDKMFFNATLYQDPASLYKSESAASCIKRYKIAVDPELREAMKEEVHELREDGSAKIHSLPPKQSRKQ